MGIILIVDDEPMVTTSLKAMLSLETPHQVHCFNHPSEALSHAESLRPDVVISDFSMPGMNGIVFLRQIKALLPDSALILLTGYADKENAIEAINTVGIYRYLEKPWDNDDLKLSIQTALERKRLMVDLSAQKVLERLREDFVSTLTHDLRTPMLAAIQTLSFFADGSLGALSDRQKELIDLLIENNRDLLSLVNTLLHVYQYEAGQRKLVWNHVNIVRLIREVVQQLQALAGSREQSLELVETPTLPSPARGEGISSSVHHSNNREGITSYEEQWIIQGDKQELKRVFTNLIGNAIHYTSVSGNIRVKIIYIKDHSESVQTSLGSVQICIEDNGRGIPAQDIPKLFQRFSQGTCKQRSSGSGLGLYLSRQIVEVHQGQIWVESEEGKGSRFYVALPAKAESLSCSQPA